MGLRNFIETLDKNGELTRIKKPVSTEYEMAGIINALGEKPVYFEKVKESSYPVVAGLVSSKELICRSLGISKDQLLPKLSAAIEHPVPPQIVQKGACQEVVETNVDLTKLPNHALHRKRRRKIHRLSSSHNQRPAVAQKHVLPPPHA